MLIRRLLRLFTTSLSFAHISFFVAFLCAGFSSFDSFGQQQTQDFNSDGTFVVPFGVTSITVECWGAGGGGSSRNGAAGGGGGGAYTIAVFDRVVGGSTFSFNVGAAGSVGSAGGNTVVTYNGVTIVANGGNSSNSAIGGMGANSSPIVAPVVNSYSGGNGGNAGTRSGGGGGGSAFAIANGQDGGAGGNFSSSAGGSGGPGTGYGGDGSTRNGNNAGYGNTPGGGGGGRGGNSGVSKAGADGLVRITYIQPTVFYSKSSGDPNNLSSWSTDPAGFAGTSPASFMQDYQYFVIQSGHTLTATGAGWSISGTGTTVHVQGGGVLTANAPVSLSSNISFVLDDGAIYNHNVADNSIWQSSEVFGPLSTVVYGGGGLQNIAANTYGNLTVQGGGDKVLSGDVAVESALNIASGNLSINGFTLTINGSVSALGSAAGSLKGSGTSSLVINGTSNLNRVAFDASAQLLLNFTVNAGSGGVVALESPVAVCGTLAVNSGVLRLNSNNLTLQSTAAITGTAFSSTCMVETNGAGSLVSQGDDVSRFVMLYPVGSNGSYTPVQVASLSVAGVQPASKVMVRTVGSAAPSIGGTDPLKRYWVTATQGFSGSVLADVIVNYDSASDVPSGTASSQEFMQKPTLTGVWTYPGGTSAAGSNPFRAAASTTLDAIWSSAVPQTRTFYSLKSGSWDDPSVWTFDPSGTQPLNPNVITPSTSPTAGFDNVVILSGRTVVVPTNAKVNNNLKVTGTLDFGSTINHTFTTITGTGRIRLAGDNFPDGEASDFVTKGQGEGTVEYYGTTRNLTHARTFFNVEVNLSSGNILSMLADYTVNGNLTVNGGVLRINDDGSTASINVRVSGNMLVNSGGKIATGKGNARHQLNLFGNFTNNGRAEFTNRTAADYTTVATDGIVDVNFVNTSVNQNVLCNGITNFYRIMIDKGSDDTYILNIDATNVSNFALLGDANENHGSATQLISNMNSLGLVRGTVRIGNSIVVPSLSVADNYTISQAAKLVVDGGVLQRNSGKSLTVFGKLSVLSGSLEAKTESGICLGGNGIFNVEGGVATINQLRTSDMGVVPNNGAYVQSGGLVNVMGGAINPSHYVFSLPSTSSVFNMSGGTLHVVAAPCKGAILINSDPNNVMVVGGNVVAETTTADEFTITSRAPFWNMSMQSTAAGSGVFKLVAANNVGASGVNVTVQPLQVLNDLRLWGTESGGAGYKTIAFNPVLNDVYIGGSFYIEKGAQYVAISGGTYPYDAVVSQPTARNTTHFNKTAGSSPVEVFYIGGTAVPLELGNLEVDRTAGYELRVTSDAARANESVALDINGSAAVTSGILNQNLFTIRTWGSIYNYGRMGTWYPGITPSRAQIMIKENPSLTINNNASSVFGNIQIDVTPPLLLTLTSDTYVERMEYVKGLVYLKGYALKVDNLWNMETGLFENSTANSFLAVANNGRTASSMIFTDGKASDGGLSLKITANSLTENQPNIINNFGPVTYPVGFTTNGGTTLYFRPAQVVVKNFSDDGYITIRPVSGYLQTTNSAGGEVLQHYWRVSHSDFAAVPTVSYRFYYRNQKGVANVDLLSASTQEASYVPGKVLDESPYTRYSDPLTDADIIKPTDANTRIVTINGTSKNGLFNSSGTGISLENANYTAGLTARFTGSVEIFYSRDYAQEARWNVNQTWAMSSNLNPAYKPHDSRQPAATRVPGANDVAVIGWVPWDDAGRPTLLGQPHSVWISGETRAAAEVVFTKMTDAGGNPVPRKYRSNFQFRPTLCIDQPAGQLVAKLVKGEGLFWNRQSDPDYTQMDIGDFARQDSSYVIYENFSDNRVISKTPPLFPNLYISNDGWGAQNWNFTFINDLETTGNIELLGNVNLLLNQGATGNITVGRNLVLFENGSGGGAEMGYGNSGTKRTITVRGDLLMRNGNSIIQVRNANSTAPLLTHELHVQGNIVQGTSTLSSQGLQLYTGANNDRVELYLDGTKNMTYDFVRGTIPALYRIIVDKGVNATTKAQFNTDFTLNGPTSGAGVAKALEIRNGTFVMNNPNYNAASPLSGNVLNLTTGNDYFNIPSTGGLELLKGAARASGNSGVTLDGSLTVSGGMLEMSGGDNPIEYSASGNASIAVSSGTINVGGQIRRSATSDAGILKYTQSGGTVVAGINVASVNNRGVFEVLNDGSSFGMSAGDLFIARAQSNPLISAFYFNPETVNIGVNANINIGHTSTPAAQIIGIYAAKALPKLRINNVSGQNPIAQLQVVPATISNLLTIDAGTTLDANANNLTLNGDLSCSGTYLPKGNTTFLSGSAAQNVSANGLALNFYDLDKTSGNAVSFGGSVTNMTISNNIYLRGGTVNTNMYTVSVKGDMLNDATHVYGGSGDGFVLNGNVQQTLTGNGTFGKLTTNNAKGVDIPVGNQFKVTNSLKMVSGIINIGKNLLDLGVNAVIEQASPFSITNMITTNISFTDNGVRKFFSAGAQATPFVYPVGSTGKYTPVTLAVSANGNSTGSITVKPANELHPSIVEDTESGAQIVDKDNALQYYWILTAKGIQGFSGSAKMTYIPADAKVTSPYTLADYFTASLPANGLGQWAKYPDKTKFDEASNEMTFLFAGKDDSGITGDYTAGAGDNSLNGAIPDNVMQFETNKNGTWTTGTIWTPNVTGGPYGAIAKVNSTHTVDVLSDNLAEYMTTINGTLRMNETYGHRLGIVNGNGTLYNELGDIPAAIYDEFFSTAGGTVEFGGTSKSYEFLGNIMEVNNLKFSGSGDRKMPNNNLLLNGSMTIAGASDMNLINYYNQKVSIKGDLIRTGGNFSAGTGSNATVSFIGTLPQNIVGSFDGSNSFNNIEVNNMNDVTVQNNIEVNGILKLTNGVINVPDGSLFRLKYGATVTPVNGNSGSFVSGTLTKQMITGNSFTFPVGSTNNGKSHGPISLLSVSGPAGFNDWNVNYKYASPDAIGLTTSNYEAPITAVNNTEYWKITGPTGGIAKISVTLDGSCGLITSPSNLRVVGWNATKLKWEVVGTSAAVTGTMTNGTVTTTTSVNLGSYSYFTLGSVTPLSDASATFTSPSTVNMCLGSPTALTVAFSGTAPWVLTYKAGANTITTAPITSSPYTLTVTPSATTIYTLVGVTANGLPGTVVGNTSVTVNVSPIPTVVLSTNAPGSSICEGTSVRFTATSGLSVYRFRINGTVMQSGSSNIYDVVLPAGTQSVDVMGTNAGACTAISSAITITVNPKPGAAGAIVGSPATCKNTTVSYSIPAVPDATGYVWSYTGSGVTLTKTNNTCSIQFSNTATSGILTVYATNSCGNGASSTVAINVSNGVAVTVKQNINAGAVKVCRGAAGITYTVPSITNATGYRWYFSTTGVTDAITGVDLSSGVVTTTNSITVNFALTATSGTMQVQGTSGCVTGNGPLSDPYAVTVNTLPVANITTLTPSGCSGTAIALNASASGGSGTYTAHLWSGDEAASLTSTTTQATSFNHSVGGSYSLTYTVTDNNGCSASASTTVVVYQTPVAEAGPDATGICSGSSPIQLTGASASGSYSGTPIWSGSGGTWTQNPNPALATFTPSGISGTTTATLTLTGANGCSTVYDSRLISWNKKPDQPSAFTVSSADVCAGQTGVIYTVPLDAQATSYQWNYTGLGTTSVTNMNSATFDFSEVATDGKIAVSAVNGCGVSDLAREMDVTVNAVPSVPLFTEAGECAGGLLQMTITNGLAGYTYAWSITGSGYTISNATTATPTLVIPNNDTLFPVSSAAIKLYPDIKLTVTNAKGCSSEALNTDQNKISVHRIPRTGSPYHIGNNTAK